MNDSKWSDLSTRMSSAVVLLALFSVTLWLGPSGLLGLGFAGAIIMHWEMARMFGLSDRRTQVVMAMAAMGWLPMILFPTIAVNGLILPFVAGFLPVFIAAALTPKQPSVYIGYGIIITAGITAYWYITITLGSFGVLVLAVLVIMSDIGGYVFGRLVGGPKFWPSVSPKKTWSGTLAGWLLAATIGMYFSIYFNYMWTVPVAIIVVLGAQLGDVAESWVKRQVGVKDSSGLIPGHGGLLDRLDGFLGGAIIAGLFLNTYRVL